MNKILAVVLLALSSSVFAGQITLTDPDEYVSGDTKYCIYENSIYSFTTEVSVNRQCPYTRTFDTDED